MVSRVQPAPLCDDSVSHNAGQLTCEGSQNRGTPGQPVVSSTGKKDNVYKPPEEHRNSNGGHPASEVLGKHRRVKIANKAKHEEEEDIQKGHSEQKRQQQPQSPRSFAAISDGHTMTSTGNTTPDTALIGQEEGAMDDDMTVAMQPELPGTTTSGRLSTTQVAPVMLGTTDMQERNAMETTNGNITSSIFDKPPVTTDEKTAFVKIDKNPHVATSMDGILDGPAEFDYAHSEPSSEEFQNEETMPHVN